jgi:hypothetical protein
MIACLCGGSIEIVAAYAIAALVYLIPVALRRASIGLRRAVSLRE